MGRARFDPFRGQFGWAGSYGGGQETKLRDWVGGTREGRADPRAKKTAGIPLDKAGKPIENLGPERYWSEGDTSWKWNIVRPKDRTDVTPGGFQKHYVDPQVKSLTREPLSQIATVREPGTQSEGSSFTRLGESDLPGGFREEFGDIAAIIPEGQDISSLISESKTIKDLAEKKYGEDILTLEGEEESAEKARRLGKAALTKGRYALESEGGTAYQQGEARRASTGMAYSSPAEMSSSKESDAIERQMAAYSTKDILGKDKYEEELSRIEGARYGAGGVEDTWKLAQESYSSSLSDAYELADEGITEIETRMGDIFSAYEGGLGQPGLKGIGFYGKGEGGISEYGKAESTAEKAKAFAGKLRQWGESDLGNV